MATAKTTATKPGLQNAEAKKNAPVKAPLKKPNATATTPRGTTKAMAAEPSRFSAMGLANK